MAYNNRGNANQPKRPFEYRYNDARPELSSFLKLEGVGYCQITGPLNDGLWPVTSIEGQYKGTVMNVPESEFIQLNSRAGEVDKCRELIGQPAFERRPYQGTPSPNQGRPFQGNRSGSDDRPPKPTLFVNNPPYGIRAKFVGQDGNRTEFQTSHDDKSTLTQVTPALVYKGDEGNHPVRDENGRILRTWSHKNWELVWLDSKGNEVLVGKNAEPPSPQSDTDPTDGGNNQ